MKNPFSAQKQLYYRGWTPTQTYLSCSRERGSRGETGAPPVLGALHTLPAPSVSIYLCQQMFLWIMNSVKLENLHGHVCATLKDRHRVLISQPVLSFYSQSFHTVK